MPGGCASPRRWPPSTIASTAEARIRRPLSDGRAVWGRVAFADGRRSSRSLRPVPPPPRQGRGRVSSRARRRRHLGDGRDRVVRDRRRRRALRRRPARLCPTRRRGGRRRPRPGPRRRRGTRGGALPCRAPRHPHPHDRAVRRPRARGLRRRRRRPGGRAQRRTAGRRAVGAGADLRRLPGTYAPEVAAGLRWLEARIWTWSWYIQSKVLRGELFEALDGLQYVRDQVQFRLLAFHGDRRPAGGRRAEAAVGEHRDPFARTVPTSLDPTSFLAALREEIDLYRRLADPLLERHGIQTAEARTVVLRALDLGLDWTPRST
jgi:hypothetical protein